MLYMHSNGLFLEIYIFSSLWGKKCYASRQNVFDFYVQLMKDRAPKSEWCGAGIGQTRSGKRMVY